MEKVHIFCSEKIGTISKDIYGLFIEHIAALIDGGVWVGENSDIPNINGVRKELIEKLKAINTPVIRWGGCTCEVYDWKEGIGPKEDSPVSMGASYMICGKVQNNDFGTHEFADLCKQCGADAYITLNVAGGTPMDAFHWIEYCNMPQGTTTLAKLREKNGSPEPLNIKYWSVGNENNEYGGLMTPEDYCSVYSRVTSLSLSLTGECKMIATGPTWSDNYGSRRFFESYNQRGHGWHCKKLDGYSLHYYTFPYGGDTGFTQEDWYLSLAETTYMEKAINDHISLLQEYDPKDHIKLVVDEWGNWTAFNGPRNKGKPFFMQLGSMREAVVAAIGLNIFNNNCDYVMMANLTSMINYIHSLFLAEDDKLIVTPTYYVFDMMKKHQSATCLRTVCAAEMINGVERVLASSSVKDGKALITLVNTHYSEPTETLVELHNNVFPEEISVEILAADDPHMCNSFENPEAVTVKCEKISGGGNELKITLPPASVVCLSFDMKENENMTEIKRPTPYDRIKTREIPNFHSAHNLWN